MSRKDRIYVVGDYWLAKRRDGKSPDIWQITTYSEKSRSDVYRSTRTGDLDRAKAAIHAHVEAERSMRPQTAEAALVAPQVALYYREHGQHSHGPATIAGSLRAFVGFLQQDAVGASAAISDLTPVVFTRFRKWRMAPHSFTVHWAGQDMRLDSPGVKGESVQRNLDDVRAALNHAAKNGRIPYAPKVSSVPTEQRSPARDVRVTIETLGAMIGFASSDTVLPSGIVIASDPFFTRWLWLMIATGCRPETALKFDPRDQWNGDLLDLQHKDAARTKKRNPVVPAIKPFKPILTEWRATNAQPVASRRRAWWTMRRALTLPANVIPKTIRHTVATELRRRGVPAEQISGLLGHVAMSRTTEVYAKYDPSYLREAKAVLTTVFEEVFRYAELWAADHLRTKVGNGPVIVIDRNNKKAQIL
jgi:hypothetical protein